MYTYLDSLYLDILKHWDEDHITTTKNSYRSISQIVIQNSDDVICCIEYSFHTDLRITCELLKPRSRDVLAHCEMKTFRVNSGSQIFFKKRNGLSAPLPTAFQSIYIINSIKEVFREYELMDRSD